MDAFFSLSTGLLCLLLIALFVAFAFEFVNGFHDTANAVATVIYTNSLPARTAVIWSGFWNFLGVLLSGIGVAYSIVNLLPVELLIQNDTSAGLVMVLALLLGAITWNLGTWCLGIPASSSHALIGSILGVGLINSVFDGQPFGTGVNWSKAKEIGLSLFLSPLFGFCCAGLLLLTLKKFVNRPNLYKAPEGDKPPPPFIRGVLIFTCTGVSFGHGSNDGQKGMGLIMLILIGIIPAHYALNTRHDANQIQAVVDAAKGLEDLLQDVPGVGPDLKTHCDWIREKLDGVQSYQEIAPADRLEFRNTLPRIRNDLKGSAGAIQSLSPENQECVTHFSNVLKTPVEYVPTWVVIGVALALGVGTMFGWKRIVVTVGEKIGKSHLTYAQGACAEMTAMSTILLADLGGLPVSTTQVLSSGVAGTMAANKSGINSKTVRNIALAWVLTLPATMALAAIYFSIGRALIG